MKKLLHTISLSMVIGLSSQASNAALPMSSTWGKGENIIHKTHIILKTHDWVHIYGILYLGTMINNSCKALTSIAFFRGYLQKNATISAPAEIFQEYKLDKDSCAIEKLTSSQKDVMLSYVLINDGQTVSAAEPSDQDADMD